MRVLVTGGAGFVGRAAVRALVDAGCEVHVAEVSDVAIDGARVHRVDLMSADATRALVTSVAPECLLHAAWFAKPGAYWTSTENLRWVEASLALARAFADAGGRRFVGVGSCAEYDWSHATCVEDETPLAPATLYGASKDALRRVLDAFARERKISFAWARLFFLYGPHEAPGRLVSSACASIVRGETTRCGSGTPIRDFIHVDDAGRALATIARSDVRGAINVGSGEPSSLRAIVEHIARAAGRPELARFGDLPDKPEPPVLLPDVTRLRALGFHPRYDLASGLAQTLAWWANHAD